MASPVVCLIHRVPKFYVQSSKIGFNRPLLCNFIIYKNFSNTTTHHQNTKLSLIKRYENFLERRFPKAFRIYQVFGIGTKEFFQDLKLGVQLTIKLFKEKSFQNFKRLEIEKHYQVHQDILRVLPTILIAGLPLANWIILPLAYKYPRHLLSHQYWTPEQKIEFAVIEHRQKFSNYQPVFQMLKDSLHQIENAEHKYACENLFKKIDHGEHLNIDDLGYDVHSCFQNRPYGISYLSSAHLSSLCKMHGLRHFSPGKCKRLMRKDHLIFEMDMAITREGVEDMSVEELRYACFMRGLNPIGLSRDETSTWLQNWVSVSTHKFVTTSMLLHCPIFLSYNHSNNRENSSL